MLQQEEFLATDLRFINGVPCADMPLDCDMVGEPDVVAVVSALVTEVTAQLALGNRVVLDGFGSFKVAGCDDRRQLCLSGGSGAANETGCDGSII